MVSRQCATQFVHGQCFGMWHDIAVPSQSLFWDVTHHTLLPSLIVTIHSEWMHIGWVTVLGVCVSCHIGHLILRSVLVETFVPANHPPKKRKPSSISSPLPHTTTKAAMDEEEVEGKEDESVNVFFLRCFGDLACLYIGYSPIYS